MSFNSNTKLKLFFMIIGK